MRSCLVSCKRCFHLLLPFFMAHGPQKPLCPGICFCPSVKLTLSFTSDLYMFWLLLFLLVIESPADRFSHLRILSSLLCYPLSLAYLPPLWSFLLSLLSGSLLLWSPLQGQCSLGLSAWVATFPSCVPWHSQVSSNLQLQASHVHLSLRLYLQACVQGFSTFPLQSIPKYA